MTDKKIWSVDTEIALKVNVLLDEDDVQDEDNEETIADIAKEAFKEILEQLLGESVNADGAYSMEVNITGVHKLD